jgi:hypothetical protein
MPTNVGSSGEGAADDEWGGAQGVSLEEEVVESKLAFMFCLYHRTIDVGASVCKIRASLHSRQAGADKSRIRALATTTLSRSILAIFVEPGD